MLLPGRGRAAGRRARKTWISRPARPRRVPSGPGRAALVPRGVARPRFARKCAGEWRLRAAWDRPSGASQRCRVAPTGRATPARTAHDAAHRPAGAFGGQRRGAGPGLREGELRPSMAAERLLLAGGQPAGCWPAHIFDRRPDAGPRGSPDNAACLRERRASPPRGKARPPASRIGFHENATDESDRDIYCWFRCGSSIATAVSDFALPSAFGPPRQFR
jgi:hypothetical protein